MMSHANGNDDGKPAAEVRYRDYSILAPPESYGIDQGNNATQTFPRKLHYLLTYADQSDDGLNKIVSWQPHGRCFMVHDAKKFASQVLPNWFMQNKLASFQRQLNLYSFKRFTTGPDKGGYYHELFLRGRSDLVLHVKRTKVKGEGHRKAAVPDSEPDFYREFPLHENKANGTTTPSLNTTTTPSTTNLLGPALSMMTAQTFAPPFPLHHPQETSQQPLHQQFHMSQITQPVASVPFSILSQQDSTPHVVPVTSTTPYTIPPLTSPMLPPGHDTSMASLFSTLPSSAIRTTTTTNEEAQPQKERDRSIQLLGQQQELFHQDASSAPSSQSLASNLMFHNNDMIMSALQAAAPFYKT